MPNEPEVPAALQAISSETEKGKQLKEAIRQNAGVRAVKGADAKTPDLAPLIPMHGDPEGIAAAMDAEAMYNQAIAEAPAMAETQRKKLDKAYIVYVKCREGHAPHHPPHGIYLTEYPVTESIAWDKWQARYKKADERYYPLDVMCQVCALENRAIPLSTVTKASSEGDIVVNKRFLWRRPRDPKRAAIEGETRVFEMGMETQNIGRRDALAKSKAAGFEVLEA